MKTKVKMIKNAHGCEDGFTSRHYKEGEVYELPNHLADNFIIAELATLFEEKENQPHPNKALSEKDYSNKSSKPSNE